MRYTITRGKNSEWPTREYSLDDIQHRAAKDGRILRDGYGRTRLRSARKILALDRKGRRLPVIFTAAAEIEEGRFDVKITS